MTEKKPTPTVIIVHERHMTSIKNDLFTFGMLTGMISLGVVLDSAAMQWIGAGMAMLGLVLRASGETKSISIAEARARLDAIERGED